MTTIGGFIDGILDGTIPPEKQQEYLRIVSDETKRLARLVTSMLNMAKIEAGELQLQPKRFNLCREIFNTMLNFEQIIEKKHIEIEGLDKLQPTFIASGDLQFGRQCREIHRKRDDLGARQPNACRRDGFHPQFGRGRHFLRGAFPRV